MNINDLTDAELIEVKEAWEGVNNEQYHQWTHTSADGWDAFDVARAYPEWCFADNPERMINTYPYWVVVNEPEFAFNYDPLMTTQTYERWVEKNKPEYFKGYMANKRAMGYCWDNGMQLLND